MIRLECNTWEELIELIGNILSNETAKNDEIPQKADQNAQKADQNVQKTEQAAVEASAPANTAPAPANTAPTPAPAAPKAVTRQDVQAKAIALMDAGRQAHLQALLVKYGVPALPALTEDKLGAFLADLEAI